MNVRNPNLQAVLSSAGVPSDAPNEIVLAKPGVNQTTKYAAFLVDQQTAETVIANFGRLGRDVVIDYEHQTLGGEYSSPDGTAPAAGWIKALRWDERRGLIARVDWTKRARELIAAREYRYFSPTWMIRPADRRPIMLGPVALTNDPALLNIAPIAAKNLAACAAGLRAVLSQGDQMTLPEILGLSPNATLPEMLAAVNDGNRVRVATALGMPEQASIEEIRMAITEAAGVNGSGGGASAGGNVQQEFQGLKTLAAQLGLPCESPEQFLTALKNKLATPGVSVEAFSAAMERVGKLENQLAEGEFERILLSDGKGKVPPSLRDGMFVLFKADKTKFLETLKALPVQAGATSVLSNEGGAGGNGSALAGSDDPQKEWDRNAALREEFSGNKDDYLAYWEANKAGQVKMPAATRNAVEA